MLTPRLKMIADNVLTKTIADIGTDHAYVPIYLSQNNIIDMAIATDLKEGPLKIAKQNIKKYNLSGKIELRLGSGINPLKAGEVSSVIIAGMGGELIVNILAENLEKALSAEYLILQPMNSQDMLRKWLSENNFSLVKEDISVEGFKVYNLIIVKKGKGYTYKNDFDLHLPEYLYSHPQFKALKEKKLREFNKIRSGLLNSSSKDDALIEKYTNYIENISEIKNQ